MNGLTVHLLNATLPNGSKPLKSVSKATEIEAGFLKKNPDTNVLSQDVREWDGENAELGRQEIFLDVWTRNLKQDAGAHQIEDNTLLESVGQVIREQVGHLSGGPFGAGTDLIRIDTPQRETPDTRIFSYRIRLVFEVLWG